MNSRERVLKALAHQEPDRVPFNLRPSDEMVAHLKKERNNPNISFSEFFRHDVHYVTITLPERPANIQEYQPASIGIKFEEAKVNLGGQHSQQPVFQLLIADLCGRG